MKTLRYMLIYRPTLTLWLGATFTIIAAFAALPFVA